MTKILHISDWHGQIWPKIDEEYDIVVSSGDMMPNCSRGNRKKELHYQERWVRKNFQNFARLIGSRRFFNCPGNHSFANLVNILRDMGLHRAYSLNDLGYGIDGSESLIYGFPWTPYIIGQWSFEATHEDMVARMDRKLTHLMKDIKVLVCHSPPHGFLDRDYRGEQYGNKQLTNLLYYGLTKDEWPELILCGHIHEDNGLIDLGNCRISNASLGWRVLEI
jgi:Icc-related predicted phosphoesterase